MSQRGWQCVPTCASSKNLLFCYVIIICRLWTQQYMYPENIWLFCSIYIFMNQCRLAVQLLRICFFVLSSTVYHVLTLFSVWTFLDFHTKRENEKGKNVKNNKFNPTFSLPIWYLFFTSLLHNPCYIDLLLSACKGF